MTHGVGYLAQMDRIFVMKDGRISEQGTYTDLLARDGDFAQFLIQYLTEEGEKENLDVQTESELEDLKHELERTLGREKLKRQMSIAKSVKTNLSDFNTDRESDSGKHIKHLHHHQLHKHLVEHKRTRTMSHQTTGTTDEAPHEKKELKRGTQLIEEEKVEVGGVKWSVYKHYMKCIGWVFSIATVAFYAIYQGFQLSGNIWLSKWSTDPLATTDEGVRNMYLAVYGVLGFLQSTFILLASTFVMVGTLNAASKLHASMLFKIIRAPMSFFDTTPIGALQNLHWKIH